MFKRATGMLLALILFAACGTTGGGGTPTTDTPAANQQGETANATDTPPADTSDLPVNIRVTHDFIGNEHAPIELVWQITPMHFLTNANPALGEHFEPLMREWAEQNPHVQIRVNLASANIMEQMALTLVEAAAGNAPDMANIDSFVFMNFHPFAQPITDVFEEHGLSIDDYYDFMRPVMMPDDEILGMWYTTDVRFMLYRKDLIDTPPRTWDEVLSISEELLAQNIEPFMFVGGRDEGAMSAQINFFWGQGGQLVDAAGNSIIGEEPNRQFLINQMEFVREGVERGFIPPRVVGFNAEPDILGEAASGMVGMWITGSWMYNQMRSAIGDEEFHRLWGVAPIPMREAGQHSTMAGGWIAAVFSQDDEKRRLAADFWAHVYTNDNAAPGLSEIGGWLPTRMSVFDEAFFQADPVLLFFRDEASRANIRPTTPAYSAISTAMQIMVSDVVTGEFTPEEAVDRAVAAALAGS